MKKLGFPAQIRRCQVLNLTVRVVGSISMNLFDDILRTHRGTATHTEDTFSFLNRSAWPACESVRNLLESSFRRYPTSESAELKSRFKTQFDSAFFELFLHELLLRLGCEVAVHPTLNGTDAKPDFLARFPQGQEVIVEAVLATERTEKERARENRLNALYDAITSKTISPNFFICLGAISDRDAIPTPKKIRKFIKERIAGLDPDAVERAVQSGYQLPSWTYRDEGGFELEITAVPKSPESRGNPKARPIGAYPGEVRWGDSRAMLKKSIDGKATKYGELGRPFVIAVNATSRWGIGRDVVVKALFGSKELGDESDGVWNVSRNTRLSGVLVTTMVPWSIHCAPLCLYHNPFAKRSCREIPWRIPQAIARNSGMQWLEGTNTPQLFELPNDWPGERLDD